MFEQAKLYVLVAAGLGIATISGTAAWKVQDWRYKALIAEQATKAQEDARIAVRVANRASAGHEQDKAGLDVQFRTIDREIERVITKTVYRDKPCLDDDGLRVLQAALRTTGTASEPSNPVSAPVAATGR